MIDSTQARTLPCQGTVDVLVAGGGPAGMAAALAAARTGASTMVVEQCNALGGVATTGGHAWISTYNESNGPRRIAGGIPWEVATRIEKAGIGRIRGDGVAFEVEGLKLLLDRMAEESRVQTLYHTFVCDTVVDSGSVTGIVVQNKDGRSIIRAKRIVDCTGDGDVAFRAGCAFEHGRPGDGRCQPVTLMFTIAGVDWPRVEAWRTDYKMTHVWERAQAAGDMRPFQKTIMGFWWSPTTPEVVGVNFTHVIHTDATRAEDLTRATIEARKQAYESIDVFRKYVAGMEKCYMVSTPAVIGIRESRRIMGDYVLTEEDVMQQRVFDDAVCLGSFFIDIHNVDGPGMDKTEWRPQGPFHYGIPYRILLPRGVDNLLVAGRCVSCTHRALGSIRVMVQCMAMGEAAGCAAALSVAHKTTPRGLSVNALQRRLREVGAIVDDAGIVG